jgi:hypothetical protein
MLYTPAEFLNNETLRCVFPTLALGRIGRLTNRYVHISLNRADTSLPVFDLNDVWVSDAI